MKITEDMIDTSKKLENDIPDYINKLSSEELDKLEFVYHKHTLEEKQPHWDLRIRIAPDQLLEFNLWSDILENDSSLVLPKLSYEPEKWFIKEGNNLKRKVGDMSSTIDVIDYGEVSLIENNPTLKIFRFNGNKIKGDYLFARGSDAKWYFKKYKPDEEKFIEIPEIKKPKKKDLTIKDIVGESILQLYVEEKMKERKAIEKEIKGKDEDLDRELKESKLKLIKSWLETQEK